MALGLHVGEIVLAVLVAVPGSPDILSGYQVIDDDKLILAAGRVRYQH